jgi:3-hydroxyacyl-CoA dehydrogenase
MVPINFYFFLLLSIGASPSQIDKALKVRVGYRRGPFEVMDLMGAAGVDKCLDLYPDNDLPVILTKLRERGWNGCAAKQGWYKYAPDDERTPIPSEEVDKLIDEHRTNQVHIAHAINMNGIETNSILLSLFLGFVSAHRYYRRGDRGAVLVPCHKRGTRGA